MINRVAIYCRLSVEDQDKNDEKAESDSIQNQKLLLTHYARKHEMEIYDFYIDDNYSGLDSSRPEFNRMLEDAKERKFDIILCKSQSRFTRDMELVEKYIHGLLPSLGIRFLGVLDYADSDDKANKKSRQINGLINEWYSEDLSDNIRSVLDKKRRDGEFIGSFAPYGYKKSAEDSHKLEIDPVAAEVVKEIFSMYVSGYSIRKISDKLFADKIPTPLEYKQRKGEAFSCDKKSAKGIWATSTIKKILVSEVYLGHMVQGKEKKLNYKSKKIIPVEKDRWIRVYDTHEPIITKEIFEQTKEILKSNKRNTTYQRYKKSDPFVGKVICSRCGKPMYITSGNKSNRKYFSCSTYEKDKNNGCGCIKNSVKKDLLQREIKEELLSNLLNYMTNHKSNFHNFNKKSSIEITNWNNDNIKRETKEVEEGLKLVSISMAQLYMDKSKGILDEECYKLILQELINKRKDWQERKRQLEIEKLKEIDLKENLEWEKCTKGNNEEQVELYHSFFRDILSEEEIANEIIEKYINCIEVEPVDQSLSIVRIHWNM